MNFLYYLSLFVFNKPINIAFIRKDMKGNKSKTGEAKRNDFLPQSFSMDEETEETCKDDEYYLGIVDSYFYTQKGEKEVEA